MRAGFFTILAVVTAACSQLPTQQRIVGGDIITAGSADYAVFAENGSAVAIRMGTQAISDDMAPRRKRHQTRHGMRCCGRVHYT